ncbi:MAG: ATP-binding protein [Caulobacteraceae bacterium]|nr:ATP-binding protein [Caulobacteraceae bacterium]
MTSGLQRRPSLVRRLVLLASVWSLAALVVTGLVLTALFQQAALSRFDQGLNDVVQGLYSGSSVEADGQVAAPPITDVRSLRAYSGRYWQVAEPTSGGRLTALIRSRSLFDAELKVPDGFLARLQKSPGAVIYDDIRGPDGEALRIGGLLSRLPGRTVPVVFLAAEDRSPVDRDAQRFAAVTLSALLLLGIGLMAAVVLQVRIGLRPLFELRREIAEVRNGEADHLSTDYPTELSPVADEINGLLAHNQEVVERQRTHVGNLAHALKTPLSVIQAEAERFPGPLADLIQRQADTMREQVEHHLRRARAAARSQGSGERTPVEPVVEELARTLEKIYSRKRVDIDWICPPELVFTGERQDLMEMVGNLLENACKWSRGYVRVICRAQGSGRLIVTVEDNGVGLPVDRQNEMLKRGVRLDEASPGSGLGLSIVDDLARAYGGTMTLFSSDLKGLGVVLDLPALKMSTQ